MWPTSVSCVTLLYSFILSWPHGIVMPSSHCAILARFFTRRQVLINRRQMPNIGGKSVLVPAIEWQSRSVNCQRHDLRETMRRRHPGNIWHAKYLELSAIHNPAVWMSFDWKIHQWWPTANERAGYRVAGSSGTFFFFYKAINFSHLRTTCLHFGIRIYRSGRLHEDEEGAMVFPVNNILL